MINLENKHIFLVLFGSLCLSACGGGEQQGTSNPAPTNPTTQVSPVNPSTTTNSSTVPANKILVTLSWAPGNNGTGVTSGYNIYHGIQSGALTQQIDVGNVTSVQLSGTDFGYTGPGRYYFSVSSHDQNGTQSLPGNEVVINIQ